MEQNNLPAPEISTVIDFKVTQSDLVDLIVTRQEDKLLKIQEKISKELKDLKDQADSLLASVTSACESKGKMPDELAIIKKTFSNIKINKTVVVVKKTYMDSLRRTYDRHDERRKEALTRGFIVSEKILRPDYNRGYYRSDDPFHLRPKETMYHTADVHLINPKICKILVSYTAKRKQSKNAKKSLNFKYDHQERLDLPLVHQRKYEKWNKLQPLILEKQKELGEIKYDLRMLNSDSKKYKIKMVEEILATTEEGRSILELADKAGSNTFTLIEPPK